MASTYLSRNTWGTATNDKIFTMSVWVKRSGLGYQQIVNSYDGSTGNDNQLKFQSTDAIELTVSTSGAEYFLKTNRLFRDTSAWYHIVFAFDSTQATSSDRYKLYVNGTQETSFSSVSYPPQNTTYQFFRNSNANNIGSQFGASGGFFNGSMSHFHFIDGTAYDATAFGECDANGVWTIKTSPSVTYGTNGFFILKNGNSVTDQSGNGNNFTVGGGTLTNTEDSPSNVFATLNPLMAGLTSVTYSNGNTTATFGAPSTWYFTPSTLAASQGKYYAEVKVGAVGTETSIGIIPMETVAAQQGAASDYMGKESDSIGYVNNGQLYKTNSVQETTSTYTTGDIIGMAFDLTGNSIQFYKNGSSVGSAITLTSGLNYTVGVSGYNSSSCNVNFGNGYFGTTAVASAGTNASGIGIFEYDVPTGYTALSTKGLNL